MDKDFGNKNTSSFHRLPRWRTSPSSSTANVLQDEGRLLMIEIEALSFSPYPPRASPITVSLAASNEDDYEERLQHLDTVNKIRSKRESARLKYQRILINRSSNNPHHTIRTPLHVSADTIGNQTCEYDPSMHIIDYLPTPIITQDLEKNKHDDDDDTNHEEKNDDSMNTRTSKVRSFVKRLGRRSSFQSIQGSMKHLGVQEEGADADCSITPPVLEEEKKKKKNSIRRRSGMILERRSDKINKRLVSSSTSTEESNIMMSSCCIDPEFDSVFRPQDMRLLALVSHNNMKHSMKQFVMANKNVLKKFRLTGTNTTLTMLKVVFGDDPDIVYGPSCKSGPLGGDAQLVAMAVTGELGGCIFFIDPMDSHPHNADIDCLVRQCNVHNILMMTNPCSAQVCMNACRAALKMGRMEMIPSFFFDLESPSVEAYKVRQNAVFQNAIATTTTNTKTTTRGDADSKRRNFPLFNKNTLFGGITSTSGRTNNKNRDKTKVTVVTRRRQSLQMTDSTTSTNGSGSNHDDSDVKNHIVLKTRRMK